MAANNVDDGGFVTPLSLFLSFFYICGLSIARGQDAFSQLERGEEIEGREQRRSKDRRKIKSYGLVARDDHNISSL